MKGYLLIAVLAFSLIASLGIGLQTGLSIGHSKGKTEALVVNLKQQQLANLRMCLFSLEIDTLLNIQEWSEQRAQRLVWRQSLCNEYLGLLGSSWLDEETSFILGEIRLFFDSYVTSLQEIDQRQFKLEVAYQVLSASDPEDVKVVTEVEMVQVEQVKESEKFLHRLLLLIGETWSN
jgi:hypothetical protein